MTRYAESRFLPSSFEIHWLSIINSFVLVLLLTAFLTIILLRVLKNDFSRYMELDDEAVEEEEVSVYRRILAGSVLALLSETPLLTKSHDTVRMETYPW
jgi:Endomembrane protein 70